ncbi:MAG: beta-ketoacyl-ACP synthase, partial [Campylobacter sp.]|nr:beta-ketoacyl-ACP synthase [Campylobacter sp.]
AHATATKQGDIAESIATNELFGEKTAISSLKSYLGHTLGACGALESFLSIMMMKQSRFYPNLNLNSLDLQCANLNYLRDITEIKTEFVMNNNFAFGGVNTSLIFRDFKE